MSALKTHMGVLQNRPANAYVHVQHAVRTAAAVFMYMTYVTEHYLRDVWMYSHPCHLYTNACRCMAIQETA